MFKKWFIRCVFVLIFVVAAISVTLAYQFTQSPLEGKTKVSAALPEETPAEDIPRAVSFAKLKPVTVVKGQTVNPSDFLSDATSSDVVAFFREEINTDTGGKFDIKLTLNDGNSRSDVLVTLYILETAAVVTREAGTQTRTLTAEDFVSNSGILPDGETYSAELITDLSGVDFLNVGRYDVELTINGVEMKSALQLVDTSAPAATAVELTVNLGTLPEPQEFVTDISDASAVTVSYAGGAEPDVLLSGERPVKVELEDEYGNISEFNSELTVLPNTEPPGFIGLKDMEAFLGDPVMYRFGVTAEDSFGNLLDFEVDSSAVDINVPGEYSVEYSVMDADGNVAREEIILTVVDLTEDAIDGMITDVLERIITGDMTTQREKAQAIFNWIKNSVSYVSDSPKDSVYEGAYRALQYRQGDCFTFYAVAEVLLTRMEIPNERVTRIEGATNHYWNLVNCDDEGWYHFDSTHNAVHSIDRFMFTDSEAEQYTEIIQRETGARNYYTYDKALHPEVVQ